jgi:HEAT repeat protein
MRSLGVRTTGLIGLILFAAPLAAQPGEEKEIGGKKVKQWVADLRHADPGVRENAIRTLMLFGGEARKAAGKGLVLELTDKDPSLRSNAAIAIGAIGLEGDDAKDGIKALGQVVERDQQAAVRVHAAATLAGFGPAARAAIPQLVVALRDSAYASWEVRRAAAIALGTVATDAKEGPSPQAINALIAAVRGDPCTKVRLHALTSLIYLGRPPAAPAPGTDDPQKAPLREAQATALRGEKAALEHVTRDPDKFVQLWARVALMRIDKVSESHLIQIGLMLKSPDVALRVNAAQALGAVGTEARSQVPNLITALKDKDSAVVAAAAAALANMGEDAQVALPALKELSEGADETLKAVAQEAMTRITQPDNKAKKPDGK